MVLIKNRRMTFMYFIMSLFLENGLNWVLYVSINHMGLWDGTQIGKVRVNLFATSTARSTNKEKTNKWIRINVFLFRPPHHEHTIIRDVKSPWNTCLEYVFITVAVEYDGRDMWFGVTVASQGKGKQVVMCGHRYIQMNAALGVCYSVGQSLKLDDLEVWSPCKSGSYNNFLEDHGLCQAGMSALIGPENILVMGSPGSYFWRGKVIF